MKRAGLMVIAVIVGTALSGAALGQTAGGGAAGGGAAGGAAAGGAGTATGGAGAVGAPLGPSTPGTAAPSPLNPSTAVGTPTQRTLTGINQNQQLRSTPSAEPSAINPGQAGSTATGTGTGPNDTRTGRSTIGGTATGRVASDSNANTGVEGPGQLSRPTAFELYSGRVPKTP
jgi:hypothetical protein